MDWAGYRYGESLNHRVSSDRLAAPVMEWGWNQRTGREGEVERQYGTAVCGEIVCRRDTQWQNRVGDDCSVCVKE